MHARDLQKKKHRISIVWARTFNFKFAFKFINFKDLISKDASIYSS